MIAIGTLIFIIILELIGLRIAGSIGYGIRSAFQKTSKQSAGPRIRWQNILIGYTLIVGFFMLLALAFN